MSAEKFDLQGTVVNAADGTPVRMALVKLQGEKSRSVLTGPEGRFQFDKLPLSDVTLTVQKPGYFSPQEFRPESLGVHTVHVGPELPAVELRLYPESVIYGRVTDENGRPVEGMQVRLVRLGIKNRGALPGNQSQSQEVTNEDGEYRVAGLRPGSYWVVVSPNSPSPRDFLRSGTQKSLSRHGFPTVLYPGVTDASLATPVRVGMGKQVQADLRLAKQPLYRVTGRVSGNTPDRPCLVFLTNQYDENPVGMVNMTQGVSEFVIEAVPPGSYELVAVQIGTLGRSKAGLSQVTVNRNLDNISLTLGEFTPIPVHYRWDLKRPPGSIAGSIQIAATPPIVFVKQDVILGDTERQPSVTNQSQGKEPEYELELEPGVFRVALLNQESYYVSAVTSGSVNLLLDDLIVAGGSRVEPIEVVLRDDGGSVHGTVLNDGRPAQGRVLLIPELAPRRAASVPATAKGTFELRGLGPGRYFAVALDDADDLVAGDPETLRQVQSLATIFELEPHGSATIELPLKRLQP